MFSRSLKRKLRKSKKKKKKKRTTPTKKWKIEAKK